MFATNPFQLEGVGSFVTNRAVNFGVKIPGQSQGSIENAENARSALALELGLDGVQWMNQVHGHDVVQVDTPESEPVTADGVWTSEVGLGLVIQTADCVPIFLARHDGEAIGAAHAGWQGLRRLNGRGVISNLIEAMGTSQSGYTAWIGPCISVTHYEVGEDVWGHFADEYADALLVHEDENKRYLDLRKIASRQLTELGVDEIQHTPACTWQEEQLFSHRQASLTGCVQGRFVSGVYFQRDADR